MKGVRLTGFLRFLSGLLLMQAATALLVVVALSLDSTGSWLLVGLFLLLLSLVTAFWFGTIAAHAHQQAAARLHQQFSKEREKIRVRAEKEKNRVLQKSQQQVEKERRRIEAKANTKTKFMFAGLLAAGGLMLFTQFMTLGLLLMTGAGGALAGYLLRTKQQLLPNRKTNDALPRSETVAGEVRKLSGPTGSAGS